MEHRKMKKEQEKSEKGARGKKLKGARSKGGNCERSKEHGPPPNRGSMLDEKGEWRYEAGGRILAVGSVPKW